MAHTSRPADGPAPASRRLFLALAGVVAAAPLLGAPQATAAPAAKGLDDPAKKEIAMKLVSSAENSSLDWKAQYKYIEDIGDGRGYTAGIIGFCSGTGDMLDLVELYTAAQAGQRARRSTCPRCERSTAPTRTRASTRTSPRTGARPPRTPAFQPAQNDERDRVYFDPAVRQGKTDGLGALGQFAYYDAIVMHGDGTDPTSFGSIRKRALAKAKPPAQGGDETA